MKQKLFVITFLTPLLALCIGTVPTFTTLDADIQQGSETINVVINQILVVIILAGVIYVVGSLMMSGTPDKGVMLTWFVSLIIWAIGNLVFDL